MIASGTRTLRTQQVADALGIGVSTLKRWIDAGQLRASRTVGRHRLIALDEALRFARSQALQTSKLEQLMAEVVGQKELREIDPQADLPAELSADVVHLLVAALKNGRRDEAKRLLLAARETLGDAARLGDDVICPVMREIGRCWSVGSWDVFEEHQASQVVALTLVELIERVRKLQSTPYLAVGASPEGDPSSLGLLLGELTLSELGWDVRNLGPNLPLKSLARAVRTLRPKLVFLTLCHLPDPFRFRDELMLVSAAAQEVGAMVVVGGRALSQDLIEGIPGVQYGRKLASLRELGRQLPTDPDLSPNP